MFIKFSRRPFTGNNFGNVFSLHRCLRLEAIPLFQWNSRITSYFKKRDVRSARKLFDEMPQKNVVTWNCMISGYVKNGMISEARELFDRMSIKNVVSWTAMLSGYAKNGRLEEARVLFDLAEKKNVACWNSMISGYLSCGRTEEGRALFDAMPVKNDVSWATMIEEYFRQGAVKEAESLFNEASCKSVLLCNAMLAGYGETRQINKSYDLFMKMVNRDVVSWTCMITCYIRVGEVDIARRLFDEMPEKDAVTWTVMIKGYLDHKKVELASELFDKMPHKDIVAWNSILTGLVHNRKLEDAIELFRRMPQRNVVSWNLILLGYLQQENSTSAREFFDRIPSKDETSWNTLISAYQTEDAFVLYVQMLSRGFNPNQGTLTTVISVCGTLAILGWGKAMHVFVVKMGYEYDIMVMSSLISMYSRCGVMNDASLVFKTMQNHDTAAWNAMMVAQAHHSSAKEAIDLFHCMTQAGFQPNHVTFLVLLNACAHSGLISEGLKYLKLMERWNLTPKPEHHACMIDLLGRSGLLAEAFELVSQLPLDLPTYAWETLLNACSIHKNYELSDLLAEKILGCQPSNVGMYVLKSKIYSARGMWKDAAHIREKLKENQLKKEQGCSWIDINGSVSCFSYNDKSHSRSNDIYKELEGLSLLIEEVGA